MEGREVTLIIVGCLVVLFYVIVFGLIGADLWSGVRKAKKRGEMRTSEAYRRTIDKLNKYYNMLIALTFVDAVQIGLIFFLWHEYRYDIPMVPLFTLFGTFYISFVEVKSIMEPSNIKEKKAQEDFIRIIREIARNQDLKERVLAIITESKENKEHYETE